MALVNVIAPPPNNFYIGKGVVHLGGVYAGHVTGSGNYFVAFVPCSYDESITDASFSLNSNADLVVYMPTDFMNGGGVNGSYCAVYPRGDGLMIEFQFINNQTANRPCTIKIHPDATFTFS